jgi:hypothetical protein
MPLKCRVTDILALDISGENIDHTDLHKPLAQNCFLRTSHELCRGGFYRYRFLPHPDVTKPAPIQCKN